jgi:hypothetical protein
LRLPAGGLLPKYTFNQRTTLSLGRVDLAPVALPELDEIRPGCRPCSTSAVEPVSQFDLHQCAGNSTETVDFNHISAASYFDFTGGST